MEPILEDLDEMFPDTITITGQTFDGFGEPLPTSTIVVKAQVFGRLRQVRGASGQTIDSTVQAVIKGAFGLTVKHKYVLPPRFVPRSPKALSVNQATDENGAHHETVYF
jgi:hypothetical protein